MNPAGTMPELSLVGGPLQRLGSRLGLLRGRTDTIALGMALGVFAWTVLALLAILEGFGKGILSMDLIAIHVRFLLAIPLLFVAETWVAPKIAEFPRYAVRTGLVPAASLPDLASTIHRVCRWKDSGLAEVIIFLVALALPLTETFIRMPGRTGNWASMLHATGGGITWTQIWYLGFCLPMFRFLLLRSLWRLGLWWYFLWRLRTLPLHLLPVHADGAAGLGYLSVIHEHFTPMATAISALCSAQFAEDISSGRMAFEGLYSLIPMVLALIAVLFIGPLALFMNKLWTCRTLGQLEYLEMASRYVNAFENRWIRNRQGSDDSFLGTSDIQSLADLTNSINVVRRMRLIPADRRLMVQLTTSVVVPLVPLLFLKYSLGELVAPLFQVLVGL